MSFIIENFAPLVVGLPRNLFSYHHPSDDIVAAAGFNYMNEVAKVFPLGPRVSGGLLTQGEIIFTRAANTAGTFILSNDIVGATFGDRTDNYEATDL